jgi:hypothetical protein
MHRINQRNFATVDDVVKKRDWIPEGLKEKQSMAPKPSNQFDKSPCGSETNNGEGDRDEQIGESHG